MKYRTSQTVTAVEEGVCEGERKLNKHTEEKALCKAERGQGARDLTLLPGWGWKGEC